MYSVGAVISGLVVANRRLVRLRHIVTGAAALGVAMLILASVPSVAAAVPAVLLVGIASILYVTSTTAIVQVEADPTMHGRVLAIQTVLLVGTAPIGGPMLGALADAWAPARRSSSAASPASAARHGRLWPAVAPTRPPPDAHHAAEAGVENTNRNPSPSPRRSGDGLAGPGGSRLGQAGGPATSLMLAPWR